MSKNLIINDLKNLTSEDFVSKHVFDKIPFAFKDRDDFVKWKMELSKGIEVDAASISIVGSSAIGVSLNPNKNFKLFDDQSDVDVAVVSSFHFQVAWRYLRNNGHSRYKLKRDQQISWDKHVNNLIYWGTIAADKLLPILPFGPQWLPALTKASSPLVGDRPVKLRIYSDYEALRSYQVQSAKTLKNQILA